MEDAGDAIVVSEDGATSGYDRRPLRTYETVCPWIEHMIMADRKAYGTQATMLARVLLETRRSG